LSSSFPSELPTTNAGDWSEGGANFFDRRNGNRQATSVDEVHFLWGIRLRGGGVDEKEVTVATVTKTGKNNRVASIGEQNKG